MKILYKVAFSLLLFNSLSVVSQQDPNYTFYRYNMNLINPAYTGAEKATELGLNVRSQWSSVEGAPETQTLIFGTQVGKKMGLGMSIISDKTFIEKQISVAVDFSYQLKLSENHNLFLGLKAGFNSYNTNTEGLVTYGIQQDPNLMNLNGRYRPNFGIGMLLKHEDYFLSLSTPKILSSDRLEEEDGVASSGPDRKHFYLAGGYNFALNRNMMLKPSILFRYVSASPLSIDFNTLLEFNTVFDLGASYRIDESISGLAIFKVSKKMQIGYAYEVSFENPIRNIDNGTHEIMMNLKF